MKQVLVRQGHAVLEELPEPVCGDAEVLVRTAYSLISTGTEVATLAGSTPEPPARRWTRRLARAAEAGRLVLERGPAAAKSAIAARLEGPSYVTGYSLAGTVIEVGRYVTDLVPGQRVACAGSTAAHHAEVVAVPRALVVPVPDGLALEHAATVTLGAIALQGVRQADVRLGEIAFVTGLGLVGQLTVALLAASGCRVFGTDLDPRRVERARALGLEWGGSGDDALAAVDHATGGHGVDVVLITASTSSSAPLQQALQLVRRKGRVVVVGAVGLTVDRGPFFAKEAELRISCSYGPGRYDRSYEEEGLDYPYAYVRWTEGRNMEEFLRLVAAGRIPAGALLERTVALDDAPRAYDELAGAGSDKPLAVLLRYPAATGDAPREPRREAAVVAAPPRSGGLGVALVGPGQFAGSVHLPNLAALAPAAALRAVVGRAPNAAREAARRWAAATATTELDAVLADDAIDAVLVCTRHDLHAAQAARALAAGKAVFLEKPAALDDAGLALLEEAVAASGRAFTVGFNRRFAPDTLRLASELRHRHGPVVIEYRVNAGKLPAGHWALGPEGGGRLIGEACHMLDLLLHLGGSPLLTWNIEQLAPGPGRSDLQRGENVAFTGRLADGSLVTLVYTSLGHPALGKERLEAHWDGTSAVIDDFRGITIHGASTVTETRTAIDKGHRELLRRFVEHAAGRGPAPVPPAEAFAVTRLTFALDRALRGADR